MRRATNWAAYAAVFSLLTTPAGAKPFPDGGATADEVAAVLRDYGVRAKISKDDEGDPMIESAISGVNYLVLFHGCESKPRCGSLEFSATLEMEAPVPQSVVNTWHNTKRFSSITQLKPDELTFTMDVFIEKGASTELLAGYLSVWETMLGEFLRHVGWDQPSTGPQPAPAAPAKPASLRT